MQCSPLDCEGPLSKQRHMVYILSTEWFIENFIVSFEPKTSGGKKGFFIVMNERRSFNSCETLPLMLSMCDCKISLVNNIQTEWSHQISSYEANFLSFIIL